MAKVFYYKFKSKSVICDEKDLIRKHLSSLIKAFRCKCEYE